MNYLAELVDHLDADELHGLRALPLALRERAVLDHIVKHPATSREALLTALDLSASHFDKLSSTILRRAYEHFAPEGVMQLLDFLKLKGLWSHLEHEFKKEEKRLLNSGDPLPFYRDALRHLALYTYEKRYVELLERCMTALMGARPDDGTAAMISAIRLQIAEHTAFSTAITETEREASRAAVKQNRENALASKDKIAMHYQLNAEGHSAILSNDGESAATALTEALRQIDEEPQLFLASERARILAQLAEALYYNDHLDEAASRYLDLFTNTRPLDIPSPHYHSVKYAQILIAQERFEDAESQMLRWFPRASFKTNDRRSSAGAVNLAKLYLTWGKLNEAKEYTDLGFEANVKAEIVLYEVQLRIFELLRFFALGEYEFASDLVDKLIRYCREKNVVPSANNLPPFIGATRLLVKSKCDLDVDMKEFDRLTLEEMPSHNRHVAVMLRKLRKRTPSSYKMKMAAT